MDIIKSIVNLESPRPTKPLFAFTLDSEAVEKNYLVLKKLNLDIGLALKAQSSSPLGYGLEFRKCNVLSPLLMHHPLWPRMGQLLLGGSKWPTSPILEECRRADLQEALEFGNHKGATSQPELLKELITRDVTHG